MTEHRIVKLKLTDKTMTSAELIKEVFNYKTMSETFDMCISFGEVLARAMNEGAEILINRKNGDTYSITITKEAVL